MYQFSCHGSASRSSIPSSNLSLADLSHPAHQVDVIRTKAFSWKEDTQALFSKTAKNYFLALYQVVTEDPSEGAYEQGFLGALFPAMRVEA